MNLKLDSLLPTTTAAATVVAAALAAGAALGGFKTTILYSKEASILQIWSVSQVEWAMSDQKDQNPIITIYTSYLSALEF